MTRATSVLVALAVIGCVEENYRCENDADCNLGADGVCEVEKRCTIRSVNCTTGREYGPLQGALSGTCYDERRDPLNPCAEGQPPARGENTCTAAVCDALPACCRSGWSEACVKQAQLRCTTPPDEVVCDTRIAITALRGGMVAPEVWTATLVPPGSWTAPVSYQAASLSWFAPARDTTAPRLGIFSEGMVAPPVNATLTIAGNTHDLAARVYYLGQSVDFARNAHDVLVLGSQGGGSFYELFDLDTLERTEYMKPFTQRTVVGEVNRDMYPDIASLNNNGAYLTTLNEATGDDTSRQLGTTGGDQIAGQDTTSIDESGRSIEFADLDNNRALDMIVSGKQMRAHMPPNDNEALNASVHTINIDCLPPLSPATSCVPAQQATASWVATAKPGIDRTTLIAAPWTNLTNGVPERSIFEIEVTAGGITTRPPLQIGACLTSCDKRWVAIATRDLDGDHVMDILAVDEILNVYTSSSRAGGTLELTLPISHPSTSVSNVQLTITGAPFAP